MSVGKYQSILWRQMKATVIYTVLHKYVKRAHDILGRFNIHFSLVYYFWGRTRACWINIDYFMVGECVHEL